MTDDNTRAFLILVGHAQMGVNLDKQELIETFDILLERGGLRPREPREPGLLRTE